MVFNKWKVSDTLDRSAGRSLGSALLITLWVYGLVVVKGFWPMAVAILVPVYSLYLGIESIAKYLGVIG